MEYRFAIIDDLPFIVDIYNSTIQTRMVTADTEPVTIESRIDWFHEHDAMRPLLVVEDDMQQVVGWISFQSFYGRPAYNNTAEISIYLHTSQRGKGLGKQVLEYSIETAKKIGIKTLLGFIFAHNEPSLKLFTHFGFEVWANLPNIAVLDGTEKSLQILGKRITP